ncbi:MAG: hypothetical protein EB140_04880, partial [Proteobacteria bacterium]|nr:hypothetical protein [Pseudomonadota bacterium]
MPVPSRIMQPTARRSFLALTGSGAVAVGASLSGCQINPFGPTSDAQALRTFLWNFETLDPAFTTGILEAEYVVHIFSGLTALNDKLEVVPDLAEKWSVSQDGRIYTFTIRKNARFHDGRA